ncbi:MAG: hypothetical protein ACRDHD_04800 [Candidatus Limnocylindria bacterium]
MTQTVQPREWRRFGFGGPPEPWPHDAQRDLDRLATSYYLDVLELRRRVLAERPESDLRDRIEELFTTATRHKHEIDYTLRHWATPVERARVEDRLGSLMRISRRMRTLVDGPVPDDWQPDAA